MDVNGSFDSFFEKCVATVENVEVWYPPGATDEDGNPRENVSEDYADINGAQFADELAKGVHGLLAAIDDMHDARMGVAAALVGASRGDDGRAEIGADDSNAMAAALAPVDGEAGGQSPKEFLKSVVSDWIDENGAAPDFEDADAFAECVAEARALVETVKAYVNADDLAPRYRDMANHAVEKTQAKMENVPESTKEKIADAAEKAGDGAAPFFRDENGKLAARCDYSMRPNGVYADRFGITPDGKVAAKPTLPAGQVEGALREYLGALNEVCKAEIPGFVAMETIDKESVINAVATRMSDDGPIEKEAQTREAIAEAAPALEKYAQMTKAAYGTENVSPEDLESRIKEHVDAEMERRSRDRADGGTEGAAGRADGSGDRTGGRAGGGAVGADGGTESAAGGATADAGTGSGADGGTTAGRAAGGFKEADRHGPDFGGFKYDDEKKDGATDDGKKKSDLGDRTDEAEKHGKSVNWDAEKISDPKLKSMVEKRNAYHERTPFMAVYRKSPVYNYYQAKALIYAKKNGIEIDGRIPSGAECIMAVQAVVSSNVFEYAVMLALGAVIDAACNSVEAKGDKADKGTEAGEKKDDAVKPEDKAEQKREYDRMDADAKKIEAEGRLEGAVSRYANKLDQLKSEGGREAMTRGAFGTHEGTRREYGALRGAYKDLAEVYGGGAKGFAQATEKLRSAFTERVQKSDKYENDVKAAFAKSVDRSFSRDRDTKAFYEDGSLEKAFGRDEGRKADAVDAGNAGDEKKGTDGAADADAKKEGSADTGEKDDGKYGGKAAADESENDGGAADADETEEKDAANADETDGNEGQTDTDATEGNEDQTDVDAASDDEAEGDVDKTGSDEAEGDADRTGSDEAEEDKDAAGDDEVEKDGDAASDDEAEENADKTVSDEAEEDKDAASDDDAEKDGDSTSDDKAEENGDAASDDAAEGDADKTDSDETEEDKDAAGDDAVEEDGDATSDDEAEEDGDKADDDEGEEDGDATSDDEAEEGADKTDDDKGEKDRDEASNDGDEAKKDGGAADADDEKGSSADAPDRREPANADRGGNPPDSGNRKQADAKADADGGRKPEQLPMTKEELAVKNLASDFAKGGKVDPRAVADDPSMRKAVSDLKAANGGKKNVSDSVSKAIANVSIERGVPFESDANLRSVAYGLERMSKHSGMGVTIRNVMTGVRDYVKGQFEASKRLGVVSPEIVETWKMVDDVKGYLDAKFGLSEFKARATACFERLGSDVGGFLRVVGGAVADAIDGVREKAGAFANSFLSRISNVADVAAGICGAAKSRVFDVTNEIGATKAVVAAGGAVALTIAAAFSDAATADAADRATKIEANVDDTGDRADRREDAVGTAAPDTAAETPAQDQTDASADAPAADAAEEDSDPVAGEEADAAEDEEGRIAADAEEGEKDANDADAADVESAEGADAAADDLADDREGVESVQGDETDDDGADDVSSDGRDDMVDDDGRADTVDAEEEARADAPERDPAFEDAADADGAAGNDMEADEADPSDAGTDADAANQAEAGDDGRLEAGAAGAGQDAATDMDAADAEIGAGMSDPAAPDETEKEEGRVDADEAKEDDEPARAEDVEGSEARAGAPGMESPNGKKDEDPLEEAIELSPAQAAADRDDGGIGQGADADDGAKADDVRTDQTDADETEGARADAGTENVDGAADAEADVEGTSEAADANDDADEADAAADGTDATADADESADATGAADEIDADAEAQADLADEADEADEADLADKTDQEDRADQPDGADEGAGQADADAEDASGNDGPDGTADAEGGTSTDETAGEGEARQVGAGTGGQEGGEAGAAAAEGSSGQVGEGVPGDDGSREARAGAEGAERMEAAPEGGQADLGVHGVEQAQQAQQAQDFQADPFAEAVQAYASDPNFDFDDFMRFPAGDAADGGLGQTIGEAIEAGSWTPADAADAFAASFAEGSLSADEPTGAAGALADGLSDAFADVGQGLDFVGMTADAMENAGVPAETVDSFADAMATDAAVPETTGWQDPTEAAAESAFEMVDAAEISEATLEYAEPAVEAAVEFAAAYDGVDAAQVPDFFDPTEAAQSAAQGLDAEELAARTDQMTNETAADLEARNQAEMERYEPQDDQRTDPNQDDVEAQADKDDGTDAGFDPEDAIEAIG